MNNKRTTREQQENNLPYYKKNDKNEKNDKKIYGTYQNVLLTDEDIEKLKTEFPNDYEERINRLSEYIESKGAKYKNHLATIRSWARRDKEKANGTNTNNVGGSPNRAEPTAEDFARIIREAEERRKAGTVGTVPPGGNLPNKGVRTPFPWERKSTV